VTVSAPALLAAAAFSALGNADFNVFVDLGEGHLKIQESWMFRFDRPVAAGDLSLPLPDGARSVRQPEDQQDFAFDDSAGRMVNRTDLAAGSARIFYDYQIPYGDPDVTLRWQQPDVQVMGLRLAVPKLDSLDVQTPSPGSRSERELDGVPFELIDILQPYRAGPTFTLGLTGLPVRTTWARWFAVGVSGLLVLGTLVVLTSARSARARAVRPELRARKERLMQALQILDEERASMDEPAYDRRRNELLTELADVLRREAR